MQKHQTKTDDDVAEQSATENVDENAKRFLVFRLNYI